MSDATSKTDSNDALALVAKVSPHVEIQDIRLMESKIKQKLLDEKRPDLFRYNIRTTTELQENEADKDNKVRIFVLVQFRLVGGYEHSEPETERLRIEASFRLIYSLASREGIEETHLAAFGNLNGVYNAFPFWREFVHSSTARMGLPALTVPLFKPVAPPKTVEEKQAGEK